ncbi:hypothetical protein [Vibrio vulnificus]|uniref:hypothetical protein n=1 Tax=Vibrio vulnificus TaxID=672 RepID=UPI000A8DE4B3|nr:hypothetical protein [Vibrio vulnificus]
MKLNMSLVALSLAVVSTFSVASPKLDPSIKHQPKDGVINVYGPGGPDTALRSAENA